MQKLGGKVLEVITIYFKSILKFRFIIKHNETRDSNNSHGKMGKLNAHFSSVIFGIKLQTVANLYETQL